MGELYYKLYLESLQNIKKLKKELAPQLEPLDSQIDELNKRIKEVENEIEEIYSRQNACRKRISDIKSRYTKDVLTYMQEKIRSERAGQKCVVQIDDDREIIEFTRNQDKMMQEQEKMLRECDEQVAGKKVVLFQFKSELKPIKEERKRIIRPLEEEKRSRDTWLWAHERTMNQKDEVTTFDDSASFSCSSASYTPSYPSSGSYEQDRYAKEQTEELRKQTDYARQQADEARKQTELARRQAEESKRQVEKANREARERRLEEERRRRQQEEAERREIQRQKEEALRRERNRMYHGVIYFKNGTKQNSSPSNDRRLAEMSAQQMYDRAMRTAISDHFKPTRYEVVED